MCCDGQPVDRLDGIAELCNACRNWFDQAGLLTVILSPKGEFLWVNAATEALLGYRLAEIAGKPIWETVIPADKAEEIRSVFARVFSSSSPLRYDNPWVGRDGSSHMIAWTSRTVHAGDELGEVLLGTGVVISKTGELLHQQLALNKELKQTTSELSNAYEELQTTNEELRASNEELQKAISASRDSEARLNTVLQLAADAILVVRDWVIVFCNQAAAEMLEISDKRKLIGQEFLSFISEIDRQRIERYHRARLQGREVPDAYELSISTPEGENLWVAARINAANFEGQPAFFVALHDITERRKAERRIKASEHRFSELFERMPDACVISDRRMDGTDGLVVSLANNAFSVLTGIDPANISHRPLSDFFGSETETIISQIQPAAEQELVNEFFHDSKLLGRKLLISYYWLEHQQLVLLIRDVSDSAEPTTMLQSPEDQLRRTTHALRISENRFRALFDRMTIGCGLFSVITGDDGPVDLKFISANPVLAELIGKLPAELEGSLISNLEELDQHLWRHRPLNALQGDEGIGFLDYETELGCFLEVHAFEPQPGQLVLLVEDRTIEQESVDAIRKINSDLVETNEQLDSTNRELLRKTEELHASHEELNEAFAELQAAKEEVDTREEQFRLFFANSISGIQICKVILDRQKQPVDFTYIDVNPAYEQHTGFSRQQVVGFNESELFPKMRRSRLSYFGHTALTGEPCRFEEYVADENKWFRVRAFQLEYGMFAASVENITKERRAKQALEESEQRIRLAQKAAQIGVWDLDVRSGNITASDLFFTLYGRDPRMDKLNMREWREWIHPDDRERMAELVSHSLAHGSVYESEFRTVWPDSTVRWLKGIGNIYRDDAGMATRVLGVTLDITERKQYEEELERVNSELTQSNYDLGVMNEELQTANEELRSANERIRQTQEELKSSEARLRQVFDSMVSALFIGEMTGEDIVNNPEYRYLRVNPGFERITGLSADAVVEKPVHEVFPQVSMQWRRKVSEVVATGEPITLSTYSPEIDKHLRLSIFPLGGQQFGVTFVDATEEVKAQQMVENERRRLFNLLDVLPVYVALVDSELDFVYSNELLRRRFGETEGRKCYEVLFGSDDVCSNCKSNGRIPCAGAANETREHADGRMYQASNYRFTDVDGRELILKVGVDVTDRVQAEASRRRLATAVEHAVEIFMLVDPDYRIIYVNPAFERIAGYGHEETVGESPFIMRSNQHPDEFFDEMLSVVTRGEIWQGNIINKAKNGKLFETETTITPILDDSGAVSSYVVVMRDVTEQLGLERRLRQTLRLEAIGTLAGGIAHDFNNILFAILGYTALVLEDLPDDHPHAVNLQEVVKAGNRARDLVKQVLAFSRHSDEERKPVMLHIIVKEALKLLRAGIPANIEINNQIRTEKDLVIADPSQMHQVVMNLCTNAMQAMEEDGGVLTVGLDTVMVDREVARRLGLRGSESYLRLVVADTGSGIEPGVLERIFEPFFTTKKLGTGTGMGLSVVHGIVASHGGAIDVETEVDRGTSFIIYLPQATEQEGEELFALEGEIARGNAERVLLIDDEDSVVDIASSMLERSGYKVQAFTDSVAALEYFRGHPDEIDVVVTDQTMPNLTGLELAKQIKATRPGIPVILCTGYSKVVSPERARQEGMSDYIFKPYSADDLARALNQVLHPVDN